MTYEQALEFIHSIARFGSKPGLRRVQMLLERMGNPERGLRFVHVAGTNGKGSTCTMLSRALAAAGLRTGLYISPFVLEFRERIQLDNEMISREELARSTAIVKQHWDALDAIGETPTEFEVVVAVAMDYFQRMAADVVVLEVGMGGRFDATNVIPPPLLSVITALSLDHTEYLGDTLSAIATEKCGIIKDPGDGSGVTVCAPGQPPEALAVVLRRCAEEHHTLVQPHRAEVVHSSLWGSDIRYGGLDLHIPLGGAHQIDNAVTVVEALRALRGKGLPVSDAHIVQGIAAASFPARLERLGERPLLLLDGAHNPDGARAVAAALAELDGRRIHAVMGMQEDKDARLVLEIILSHCASLTAVAAPDSAKALPPQRLAALAQGLCPQITACAVAADGLRAARARCAADDVLLVCGSLYLASHLRPLLMELGAKRV